MNVHALNEVAFIIAGAILSFETIDPLAWHRERKKKCYFVTRHSYFRDESPRSKQRTIALSIRYQTLWEILVLSFHLYGDEPTLIRTSALLLDFINSKLVMQRKDGIKLARIHSNVILPAVELINLRVLYPDPPAGSTSYFPSKTVPTSSLTVPAWDLQSRRQISYGRIWQTLKPWPSSGLLHYRQSLFCLILCSEPPNPQVP